jgi:hypothetical protein
MPQDDNTVLMENVRIIFRNFTGKEGPYNREGDRDFSVLLTPELADQLLRDGWNVKTTRERELDEGEITGGDPILPVKVSYKGRPPTVVMVSSRGRTNLGESEIDMLDYADIQNVDLIVRPFDWSVNGKTGRKAYLKSIYVTINEDELDLKYADVKPVGHMSRGED